MRAHTNDASQGNDVLTQPNMQSVLQTHTVTVQPPQEPSTQCVGNLIKSGVPKKSGFFSRFSIHYPNTHSNYSTQAATITTATTAVAVVVDATNRDRYNFIEELKKNKNQTLSVDFGKAINRTTEEKQQQQQQLQEPANSSHGFPSSTLEKHKTNITTGANTTTINCPSSDNTFAFYGRKQDSAFVLLWNNNPTPRQVQQKPQPQPEHIYPDVGTTA